MIKYLVMDTRSRLATVVLSMVMASFSMQAQAPTISNGGIVNAASFTAGQAVAPGSLVAIFGSNLAANLTTADSIPLSTKLGGVSVTFNGVAAPLSFVTAGQVNAQVPFEIPTGTANVIVTNNGVPSPAQPVVINTVGPGVFASNGHAIAVIATDPNDPRYGTLAAPAGSIAGLTTNPAKAGDVLIVYANGLGPVTPAPVTGAASLDALRQTTSTPTVLIGNVPAQVPFSGLAPQFVGVYQLNIVVPQVPAGSAIPLQIQMGGITSTIATTIAIQ